LCFFLSRFFELDFLLCFLSALLLCFFDSASDADDEESSSLSSSPFGFDFDSDLSPSLPLAAAAAASAADDEDEDGADDEAEAEDAGAGADGGGAGGRSGDFDQMVCGLLPGSAMNSRNALRLKKKKTAMTRSRVEIN
jgi:hypothetical protein